MTNYYIKDSNNKYWQIQLTQLGEFTPNGPLTNLIDPADVYSSALVTLDWAGNYWQFGISTLGEFEPTSVGATTVTLILVPDSYGAVRRVLVDPLGQFFAPIYTPLGYDLTQPEIV